MKNYIKMAIVFTAVLIMQTKVYAGANEFDINKNILENALLVGDSFTAKLSGQGLYEKYNVSIWATGGYTATDLLNEVGSHKDCVPSKVILLVGINDLVSVESIDDVSISNESELIQALDQTFHVPVYVQLVFPPGKSLLNVKPNYSLKKIDLYNNMLKDFCEKNGYYWIDTRYGFLDTEGYLKYTDDSLHISDDNYEEYLKNIVMAISEKEIMNQ